MLIRLDYERQCYQHAEMILRNRLRHLQAAVGKTIKAADQSKQPVAIVLPDTGCSRSLWNSTASSRPPVRRAALSPPKPEAALTLRGA